MGNIGIWQLIIVAVIVLLLFGTKKLRNIGGDLGSAVKGFKKAMNDDNNKDQNDSNIAEKSVSDKSESTTTSKETKSKDKV